MPDRIATQQALHTLFYPRAVAVIGASDDTTKHGYIVLNNLRAAGFTGGLYGISRRLKEVDGIPCYPDLASVPEPVDAAFLAIPAEAAVQAVRDCARAGVSAAIVGSAGYAESLEAGGAERQAELARIAAEEGIRIVGPNCNGIYNAHLPLSIGFNTAHAKRQKPGGISIFSHSGALFDAMAGRLHMLGAGLSLFASAGNEADLSVLDYMEYAIGHAPTRVIALLIDSLDDGVRFRRLALRAAAAGKHVVALKIGGSEAGARAAVAHSSRIAGDNAAYAALFGASGVATVASLEGFMTAAALLDRYGRRVGALGALSTSGAGASLLADRCAALGVPLAVLSADTHRRIDLHRMFSRIGNPLDLGIFGGMRRAGAVPSLLANDAGVGAALALVHSMNPWQGDPIRAALATARASSGKPLLIVAPGGMPEAERAWYETHGMNVFTETDIVLEAIGALLTPLPAALAECPGPADATLPPRPLSESESLRLLGQFGVTVVETTECSTFDAACAAAERVGWPVVLKGVAEGVAHKSELGLVRTGLRDAGALQAAYATLGTPRAIVQPMVQAALEAIAGISRSPGVGLVLLCGLGGIYAEALRDVCIWPIPVSRAAIEGNLAHSSLGRVLASPRWQHPEAVRALVELLVALQSVAVALGDRLEAVDVNPVMLGAAGAVAVDALVVPRA
ncbi:MAG TPA: acetate--CoA ligase family protein [Acetobacteraceae bacterium]|nr:acetate--CoA ligase family protein [Acetobacteraceae bacterium]